MNATQSTHESYRERPRSVVQGFESLVRGLRWGIYGLMVGVEPVAIVGLTAIGLVLLAMCALVHFTVAHSHFPMVGTLALGGLCLASTVLFYMLKDWVKPDPQ